MLRLPQAVVRLSRRAAQVAEIIGPLDQTQRRSVGGEQRDPTPQVGAALQFVGKPRDSRKPDGGIIAVDRDGLDQASRISDVDLDVFGDQSAASVFEAIL